MAKGFVLQSHLVVVPLREIPESAAVGDISGPAHTDKTLPPISPANTSNNRVRTHYQDDVPTDDARVGTQCVAPVGMAYDRGPLPDIVGREAPAQHQCHPEEREQPGRGIRHLNSFSRPETHQRQIGAIEGVERRERP